MKTNLLDRIQSFQNGEWFYNNEYRKLVGLLPIRYKKCKKCENKMEISEWKFNKGLCDKCI